ncbi:hypothetical protein J6590_074233 [Homalodisca vitripennis]|nr:hypothetical protein J6590_074233 [Homalodisca vitripennis]
MSLNESCGEVLTVIVRILTVNTALGIGQAIVCPVMAQFSSALTPVSVSPGPVLSAVPVFTGNC